VILITGADGFIGRSLLAKLKELGHLAIPLRHGALARALDTEWECDLTRPDHLITLETAAPIPETVIHLAGYVEIALRANLKSPDGPPLPAEENVSKIYAFNVGATANVLNYCLRAGVRRLIFASSQTVYGIPQTIPVDEDAPCAPLEHYAMSKLCCEQLLRTGARQGLDITALRLPGIFSETRRSGVVFQFCRQALEAKLIQVTAGFPLPLDVLHLADAVAAFAEAVGYNEPGWTCLNISTGLPCSLDLLAEAVAALVPGCRVAHGQIAQPIVQMDPTRANTLLGWKAQPREMRLTGMLTEISHAN